MEKMSGQTEEVTNQVLEERPQVEYSNEEKLQAMAALNALANITNVKFTLPRWSQHTKPGQQPYITGSTELSLFSQEELSAIKEISKKYIQILS